MSFAIEASVLVERLAAARVVRGIRRRLPPWSLVALAFLAVENVSAQSPRRTTVGRLLGGGPIDTIDVEEFRGGEMGSSGSSLRLVRGDSSYTGTLRLQVWVTDFNTPVRHCDTVMTASMSATAAKHVVAFLRPTAIEPGEASMRLPVTDVEWNASARLTSGSNAVVVQNGTMLLHGESRYRTPRKRGRNGRQAQFIDPDTRLMKVQEMLRPHLQPERLLAFARTCGR